jgi:glycosyltransferase involved in cell wall biosynthesis
MNVLVIEDIASSLFGGAERTLRGFCEESAKTHRLHLVFDRTGDYVDKESQIYATVTRVCTLPLGAQRIRLWATAVLKLRRLCKAEKIDLIVTHVVHSVSMLRVLRILTGIKVVILFKWICSMERVGHQAEWGLRGLDCGISVSRFVANYWISNGFRSARMKVVPEGVDVSGSLGYGGVRSSENTAKALAIGFAGRIVQEKGLHILLEAVARLRLSGIAVDCFVAGTFAPGSDNSLERYHTAIQKEIHALGLDTHVHFLGYVKLLADFLMQMDVVAVPSLCQDAQPIVLMETMAVGTPVIASRVGGIPEMLTGKFGKWLCDPGNVDDLYNKLAEILTLATSEKMSLRRELRQYAHLNYSISAWRQRLFLAIGLVPPHS